jgi:cytochrome c-type biogenesis protein CcmH/NrfG
MHLAGHWTCNARRPRPRAAWGVASGVILSVLALSHSASAADPPVPSRPLTPVARPATNVPPTAPPAKLVVDLVSARQSFLKGNYAECIRQAEQALADRETEEEWRLLLLRALLATGRYAGAQAVLNAALERYSWSLPLRWLGRDVVRFNDQPERADRLLFEISDLVQSRPWAYQDAANMVAFGQAALLLGADPKQVLDQLFERAKKADPTLRDAYLAIGQVALDKGDFALAAKVFNEGLKKLPEDPDLHHGLARAFAPSERRLMVAALERALDVNTNHVPSYLLLADHLIDGEDYTAALRTLESVFAVNPWQPEAWAYRAVIAHLAGDAELEARARDLALWHWPTDPRVDHLIGLKLSQKYRFAEGAECQRRALAFDAKFLPAKIQLAQDLLRLGEEQEGWQLAEAVHEADGYDVTAYNLSTLRDHMEQFATLTNRHFVLRMGRHEAEVYGQAALELLGRARETLCRKYGVDLPRPTVVEIFPEQKDFGVRTFGLPGNPGYLGVCFGPVITANSPASQAGHEANWQAVLWHEFCHVVTLTLTKNKMPRWLSEGISVYEELQANPTWGQAMTPQYREMVLGKDLAPVGKLSAAFLAPKSDRHLQFAYYQSALVVEFLAGRFGLESLKKILRDLGDGLEINQAIARHTAPLEKIEADFAAFARARAEQLAPELDWEKPKAEDLAKADPAWLAANFKNYHVLLDRARRLLREKKFAEAKKPLETLLKCYPAQTGSDSAYALLAETHRGLGETNDERRVLAKLAELDADNLEAYQRLMELGAAAQDWPAVALNAERFLAVNPLLPAPHRFRALAQEALGQPQPAIASWRTVLRLDPPDPAEVHFRLARLLHQAGDAAARRHVLQALEDAPRFRDAHRLLLEITRAKNNGDDALRKPAAGFE